MNTLSKDARDALDSFIARDTANYREGRTDRAASEFSGFNSKGHCELVRLGLITTGNGVTRIAERIAEEGK
jgi:hypothetical protein